MTKVETRGRKTVITPMMERIVRFMNREGYAGRQIAELLGISLPTLYKARDRNTVIV